MRRTIINIFLISIICMAVVVSQTGCTKKKAEYKVDEEFVYNNIQESESKKTEQIETVDTKDFVDETVTDKNGGNDQENNQKKEESTEILNDDGSGLVVKTPEMTLPYVPFEQLDNQMSADTTEQTTEQSEKKSDKKQASDKKNSEKKSKKNKTNNKKKDYTQKSEKSTPTDASEGKDSNSSSGDDIQERADADDISQDATSEEQDLTESDNKADEVVRIWCEGTLGHYIWGETPDTSSLKVYAEFGDGTKKEINDYTIDMNYPERHVATYDNPATYDYGVYNATISYEGIQVECPYNLMILYVWIREHRWLCCKDPVAHHAIKDYVYSDFPPIEVCHECEYFEWIHDWDTAGNEKDFCNIPNVGWGHAVPIYYDYIYTLDDLRMDDYYVNNVINLDRYTIYGDSVKIYKDSVVSQGYVASVDSDIWLWATVVDKESLAWNSDNYEMLK